MMPKAEGRGDLTTEPKLPVHFSKICLNKEAEKYSWIEVLRQKQALAYYVCGRAAVFM